MAERIIATNDAYAKVGDKYLNDIALDMMWDLNGEKAGWESKEDIPNETVWDDIGRSFDILYNRFLKWLTKVSSENYLVIAGSVGRWDGTRHGYTLIPNDPDRHLSDFLKDCDYITLTEDENGDVHVHGVHHDGSVSGVIRILTEEGYNKLYDEEKGASPYDPAISKPLRYSDSGNITEIPLVTIWHSWLMDRLKDVGMSDSWEIDDGVEWVETLLDRASTTASHEQRKDVKGAVRRQMEEAGISIMDTAYGYNDYEGSYMVAVRLDHPLSERTGDVLHALAVMSDALGAVPVTVSLGDVPRAVFMFSYPDADKE